MAEVIDATNRLDALARELGKRSEELAKAARTLDGYVDANGERVVGVQEQYEDWMDTFETGLYQKQEEGGSKMPSEAMRERLGRRDMPPQLLGAHRTLLAQRNRLEARIRDIKAEIEAQRSILSALKLEMEATR